MTRSRLPGLAKLAFIFPALALAAAGAALAQEEMLAVEAVPDLTVLDSVYTVEQADRGTELFESNGCAVCHGEDMRGGDFGPSLAGIVFIIHWRDQTAEDLFEFMQVNMPPANGGLPAQTYIDIIAAIFATHGFPASDSTVLSQDTLGRIAIIETRDQD